MTPEREKQYVEFKQESSFDQVPAGLRAAIASIHAPAHLRRLHKASIQAASLEDFSWSL